MSGEGGEGMERIFFYSLKGRWKEYAVVLFCGIFTISILFWTTALGDCLYKIAPSGLSETVEEVFTFFSFLLTYELLFFLDDSSTSFLYQKTLL